MSNIIHLNSYLSNLDLSSKFQNPSIAAKIIILPSDHHFFISVIPAPDSIFYCNPFSAPGRDSLALSV